MKYMFSLFQPLIARDIRNSFRSKTFPLALGLLSVALMVLFLLVHFGPEDGTSYIFKEDADALIWLLLGAVLFLFAPIRAVFAQTGGEGRPEDLLLLTHISAGKFVFQKWMGHMLQVIFLVVVCLPYFFARVYFGYADLTTDAILLINLVFLSALAVAVSLWLSGLPFIYKIIWIASLLFFYVVKAVSTVFLFQYIPFIKNAPHRIWEMNEREYEYLLNDLSAAYIPVGWGGLGECIFLGFCVLSVWSFLLFARRRFSSAAGRESVVVRRMLMSVLMLAILVSLCRDTFLLIGSWRDIRSLYFASVVFFIVIGIVEMLTSTLSQPGSLKKDGGETVPGRLVSMLFLPGWQSSVILFFLGSVAYFICSLLSTGLPLEENRLGASLSVSLCYWMTLVAPCLILHRLIRRIPSFVLLAYVALVLAFAVLSWILREGFGNTGILIASWLPVGSIVAQMRETGSSPLAPYISSIVVLGVYIACTARFWKQVFLYKGDRKKESEEKAREYENLR